MWTTATIVHMWSDSTAARARGFAPLRSDGGEIRP